MIFIVFLYYSCVRTSFTATSAMRIPTLPTTSFRRNAQAMTTMMTTTVGFRCQCYSAATTIDGRLVQQQHQQHQQRRRAHSPAPAKFRTISNQRHEGFFVHRSDRTHHTILYSRRLSVRSDDHGEIGISRRHGDDHEEGERQEERKLQGEIYIECKQRILTIDLDRLRTNASNIRKLIGYVCDLFVRTTVQL